MKHLKLNIWPRALTSAYICYGDILSYINVQQIHSTGFKYANGYVLAQEE